MMRTSFKEKSKVFPIFNNFSTSIPNVFTHENMFSGSIVAEHW